MLLIRGSLSFNLMSEERRLNFCVLFGILGASVDLRPFVLDTESKSSYEDICIYLMSSL